jgi:peptidoglycan/LPS O-acetylase OafA/YrhL
MYHLVVMFLLVRWFDETMWTNYWAMFAYLGCAIGGTLLTAWISYRFIESPLLKLKPH